MKESLGDKVKDEFADLGKLAVWLIILAFWAAVIYAGWLVVHRLSV